jgi:hypothetical protein
MADVVTLLRQVPSIASIVLADAEEIAFDHGCLVERLPRGASDDYEPAMRALVDRHDIAFLYLGSDEEALALSRHDWARRISHLDTVANTSLVLDKYRLHTTLQAAPDTPPLVPEFALCSTVEAIDKMIARCGSVVARPIKGRGSRGVFHIVDERMRADYPLAVTSQEYRMPADPASVFYAGYLPGDKYSADCIFDGGALHTCMMRNNGSAVKYRPPTMQAVTSEDPEVYGFAAKVGRVLGLSGFHQVECGRAADGTIGLIEINPRLDATLPITRCYAENFYELLLHRTAVGLMKPRQPLFKRFFVAYTR